MMSRKTERRDETYKWQSRKVVGVVQDYRNTTNHRNRHRDEEKILKKLRTTYELFARVATNHFT
jgi:hypothetical protein